MYLKKNYCRVDTLELKALISRKIGHQRAEKYFDHLKRLFTYSISKCEFDKLCLQIVGRENIPLHNQLIRSIIKNACVAKVPPPFKSIKRLGGGFSVKVANGPQRNSPHATFGDAFLSSPRIGRPIINRYRKSQDRPSPLGPLGKSHNAALKEMNLKTQEQQTELHSLGSRPPVEVLSVEEGEEVEQLTGSPGVQSRSPVKAPLGIHMKSTYGKTLSTTSLCRNGGELPNTRSLRSHLEQKLSIEEGIGVSVDCVNLLNNAVDVYLKRLIEPCLHLANSRHRNEQLRQFNGMLRPGFRENFNGRQAESASHACLLDFRVAMESSPQILGNDWTVQLEKIALRASEEEQASAKRC